MKPTTPFFLLGLLFSCFSLFSTLSAQILQQDFDDLEDLEEFKGNPPTIGQVERINLDPSNIGEKIFFLGEEGGNKFLGINKFSDQRRHFDRVEGIRNQNLSSLKIRFTFSVNSVDNSNRFAAFIVGNNLYNTSSYPIRAERWGQVGIHINEDGSFFLANEGMGNVIKARSDDFNGEQEVTIIMNNSGESLSYEGPGERLTEINDKMVDVWIGEERVIENSMAYFGADASINALKFIIWSNDQTATARMDGLLIESLENVGQPVELISFSASLAGEDVMLKWETASEKNSSHFEVERSLNGKEFEKIGTIPAAGNSHVSLAYSFPDLATVRKFAGILYYRLQQVDLDGTSEYSPVTSIKLPASVLPVQEVYPNPFTEQLNIKVQSDRVMNLHFRLLNLQGKVLLEEEKIFETPGLEQLFRVFGAEKIQQGFYLLEVSLKGEEKQRFRIVKY